MVDVYENAGLQEAYGLTPEEFVTNGEVDYAHIARWADQLQGDLEGFDRKHFIDLVTAEAEALIQRREAEEA